VACPFYDGLDRSGLTRWVGINRARARVLSYDLALTLTYYAGPGRGLAKDLSYDLTYSCLQPKYVRLGHKLFSKTSN